MEILASVVVVAVIFALPCACFTMRLADTKNYNVAAWFIGGMVFGPIALIAAAGLPPKEKK